MTVVWGRRLAEVDRIWDAFLTPQDREDCGSNPPRSKNLGGRPALLLVDNYRRAFAGTVTERGTGVDTVNPIAVAAAACLPSLVRLLGAARAAAVPVVHASKQTSAVFGIRDWAEPRSTSGAQQGDDYDLVPELSPRPGEALVLKTAPSSFFGTPLLQHLLDLEVDTVLVAGESTSGCVRATVVDARSYGFTVGVVYDCTFDRHTTTHALNLFDMHRKYARLLDADEAVRYLATPRSTRGRRTTQPPGRDPSGLADSPGEARCQ